MLKTVLEISSIIRVQCWNIQQAPPAALDSALGITWPRAIGSVARGRADILCIGPTDWLVVASSFDAPDLLRNWFDTSLDGTAFRATDLSQALAHVEVRGREVRDLLAKGCSLDLHSPLFPTGRALRTRFAGMPVIVRCTRTAAFELIVARSYLDFLLDWLEDAALEFELPP